MIELDLQWYEKLKALVNQPPIMPRDPLVCGETMIGSVVSDAFRSVIEGRMVAGPDEIHQVRSGDKLIWRITGDATRVLQQVAHLLRQARYARVMEEWRDEPLAVLDDQGQPIGVVERGTVRALGIATHGVHLVGCTPDQKVWIQQRAWNKANDPGLWDTLMGGMISALDTLDAALARETLEEAGLQLEQLTDLRRASHFQLRMPASDDQGLGFVVERIDWFEAIVPEQVLPQNRDGEVQQFLQVSQNELRSMLHNNEFTAEAAMIFALSSALQGDQ